LKGNTDLDILIDVKHRSKAEELILKNNFKHVLPPKHKQYPNIDNFIGFDEEKGKFVHLHLYFKVITGQHLLKDYILPLDKIYLDTCKEHKTLHIKVPRKEDELVVFTLRTLIKSKIHEILLKGMQEKIKKEFTYLIEGANAKKIDAFLKQIPKSEMRDIVKTFLYHVENKSISKKKFLSLSLKLKKACTSYRRLSLPKALYIYYKGKLCCIPTVINPIKGKFRFSKKRGSICFCRSTRCRQILNN